MASSSTDRFDIVQTAIRDVEADQAGDIATIRDLIAGGASADDVLDDAISEMKGYFGSLEANRAANDIEAEYAIAEVEAWITNNVSNAETDKRIAGALTIRNVDELSAAIAA